MRSLSFHFTESANATEADSTRGSVRVYASLYFARDQAG